MPVDEQPNLSRYDAIVVGGGFFGCSLAVQLARKKKSVLLLERGSDFLSRASYHNQARVHHGYHYPRHFLTVVRSRMNFPRFVQEYQSCIVSNFEKFYAIAKQSSKTNAQQFKRIMQRAGLPIEEDPGSLAQWFDPRTIEAVFKVQEYAFDAIKLKKVVFDQMMEAGVHACLSIEATHVVPNPLRLQWQLSNSSTLVQGQVAAQQIFNCTYSGMNQLLHQSQIPLIPLKHEVTELCLIEPPALLSEKSVTVMCGPFFSIMPFPSEKLCTLSHVRYTPHTHWIDEEKNYFSAYGYFEGIEKKSNYEKMIRDASRYMPILKESKYLRSLWEIKTVLPASETNDARPILYQDIIEVPGLTCVMGGKIDNIYDAYEMLATSD